MVAMKIQVELNKLQMIRRLKRWNIEKLVRNKELLSRKVDKTLIVEVENNVKGKWSRLKDVVKKSAETVIQCKKKDAARKSWVNNDTISKMDQRRKWKNVNTKEEEDILKN